jgi:hypothetical protein
MDGPREGQGRASRARRAFRAWSRRGDRWATPVGEQPPEDLLSGERFATPQPTTGLATATPKEQPDIAEALSDRRPAEVRSSGLVRAWDTAEIEALARGVRPAATQVAIIRRDTPAPVRKVRLVTAVDITAIPNPALREEAEARAPVAPAAAVPGVAHAGAAAAAAVARTAITAAAATATAAVVVAAAVTNASLSTT